MNGFLAENDPQVVVLRSGEGQTIAIPRAQVEELRPAGVSLMPEGLLAGMSDQEVRDLLAYLRSTQPLNDGN